MKGCLSMQWNVNNILHSLIIVRNETNDERQIGVKKIVALELHHTLLVNPPSFR